MYLLSSLLFIGVIFCRTLEPKVFQWLTDNLVQFGKNHDASVLARLHQLSFLNFITNHFQPLVIILFYFAALYVLVTLVRSLTVFTANAINAKSTETALKRLRDKLFSHLQSISLSHYVSHSKGEIIQRCTNDLEVLKDFVQNNIVEVIRLLFMVVFSLIMLCNINVAFALVSMCLMPIVVILSFRFYHREKEIWEYHESESDKLNTIIQENIQGIRTIKAFAKEDKAIEQFEAQNQRRLEAGIKHITLHSLYWPAMNFVIFAQIVVSNLFGIYCASKGIMTLGELLGAGLFINMMLWPLKQVSNVIAKFTMAMVAIERIDELLSIPEEEGMFKKDMFDTINGEIEFRNVSFSYPGKSALALKNVSFHIKPGEKVAIIGATGSGKSTIVKLLLRFYEPTEGSILLDGRNISLYSKQFLRHNLGVALQNSILFSASIKENLKSVKTDASTRMLTNVMEMARIDDLLQKTDQGIDCMIGEKGVNLSGGQKQRLALARLILKSPDMFILDDVTSYIDEINEQAILGSLSELMSNKTTIVISHKLSSIVFAERVIVLNHGIVEQIGDRENLAEAEGYFNIIYHLQTEKSLQTENSTAE